MSIENQEEDILIAFLRGLEEVDEKQLERERSPDHCRHCRQLLSPEIDERGRLVYNCFECDRD